jgi:acetylornithine deacetylase/succinyl-diaminopimelate desuccinylase-like protein
MIRKHLTLLAVLTLGGTMALSVMGQKPSDDGRLTVPARDLLRQLVEIDTTPTNGCTKAAEAMALCLRAAGFADTDVQLIGPRPDRQNLVVRFRGRGAAKPILFIDHLDVVNAPSEGWNSDPFRFNETTRAYFDRMSMAETGAIAGDLRAVAKDPPDLEAARRLAAGSVLYNSILHTTCVATRLSAGHANNALPQTAEAIVNGRVFPGDTMEYVRDTLTKVLADPKIEVTPLGSGQPSPASPLVPEVFAAVEKLSHERWPGIPVLPVMDPWGSDSAKLRRAGIIALGVSGNFGELDFGNCHGANERLSVVSFDEGTGFLYELIKMLGGNSAGRDHGPTQ